MNFYGPIECFCRSLLGNMKFFLLFCSSMKCLAMTSALSGDPGPFCFCSSSSRYLCISSPCFHSSSWLRGQASSWIQCPRFSAQVLSRVNCTLAPSSCTEGKATEALVPNCWCAPLAIPIQADSQAHWLTVLSAPHFLSQAKCISRRERCNCPTVIFRIHPFWPKPAEFHHFLSFNLRGVVPWV